MIADAERLQFFRVELEEVVLLEAPAPVDADGARRVHPRALIECQKVLHGDDRHACARGICHLDETLADGLRAIRGCAREIRKRLAQHLVNITREPTDGRIVVVRTRVDDAVLGRSKADAP